MGMAILLLGIVYCAPPIELDPVPKALVNSKTIIPAGTIIIQNNEDIGTTAATTEKAITVGIATTPQPQPQQPTPNLSARERKALISHLSEYDIKNIDPLILTPRQRLAILQELEHQKLGLPPFTDPTPWQRLSREQQVEFNKKYLSLRKDLQEFSRNQFLSLPEDRQAHAYQAFLSVDIQTLAQVIQRELEREQEALRQEQQTLSSLAHQNTLAEQNNLVEQQKLLEHQRLIEQQRLDEKHKLYEQQRYAEQQKLIEQQRLAKKQQEISEQEKVAKRQRLIEQQRVDEKHKLYEQRKLAEQKSLIEQDKIAEHQRLVEKFILAEQVRLYEQQKLTFQQNFVENEMLSNHQQNSNFETQRQEGINKLFEIALAQGEDTVTSPEEPRSQVRKTFHTWNEISDQNFLPTKKLLVTNQPIKAKLPFKQNNHQSKQQISSNIVTKQYSKLSHRRVSSSFREMKRLQKRINIRRLMFDPRRGKI